VNNQNDHMMNYRLNIFDKLYTRTSNRVERWEHGISKFDSKPLTWSDRFQAFNSENPHIMSELRRLALDAKSKGVDRWSISALIEVVRYNHAISSQGDAYKINNNFRAYYARELMKDPRLEGFFQIRKAAADVDAN